MPAKSGKLGFDCYKCGKDYGSWGIENLKNQHENEENKNKAARSGEDRIQIPRRSKLKPVEYAWKSKVESDLEVTRALNTIKYVLSNYSLLPEERKKVVDAINSFRSKIESRLREFEQEDLKDAEWNVTEEIVDEEGKKVTRTWNPIKLIREYREVGDPFLHVNPPFDFFFNKVLVKHSYVLTAEYIPEERMSRILKGFEVICKYREPFYDKNWRYTWVEWYHIVMYAEAKSSRKAAKMLRALDGEEGRISHRYIQRQKGPVLSFAKDFDEYAGYFFDFYIAILRIIKNDPELKEEYETILKEKKISRENYEKKIKQDYLNSIGQRKELSGENNSDWVPPPQGEKCSTISNEVSSKAYDNIRVLDNGILEVGLERIKVNHSNPNYEKEMQEFDKLSKRDKERLRIEEKKPRKNTTCVFNPFLLPIDIRQKLHEEGEVLPW
jgi:hypothetical protein